MTKKNTIIAICLVIVIIVFFLAKFSQKDEITTIKFSSWGSQSEVKIVKSAIQKFEDENPDIKIDFIHIPQNYFQKLHLLFASGLEPDIIFINNQNIKLYTEANLLEDLTPYFNETENIFYKEALNCFKTGNKLYAIPRDISNLVIFYNKNIFKETGIKIPEKIKDIYELRTLANKVTNKEHWGISFEENPLFWVYYLASNGGGILTDNAKETIINKEESTTALDLYSDMVNKQHIAPTKAEIGSMTTAQMFMNGKLAMYLSGRWMIPKFRETITFDWDVIEFPSSEKHKLYIDSSGWAISKRCQNKAAAVKFIKYISNKNVINEFSESGLIIPARIDSSEYLLKADKGKAPKNSIAFINMLKEAKPTPVNKNYNSIIDIVTETTPDIFSGKKRSKDAFNEEVILKINKLLH